MIREKTWTVSLFLTEGDGVTRAEAVLHSGANRELRGSGVLGATLTTTSSPRSVTRSPPPGHWLTWHAGCVARRRPTSRT